jgi:hypothetical protein
MQATLSMASILPNAVGFEMHNRERITRKPRNYYGGLA